MSLVPLAKFAIRWTSRHSLFRHATFSAFPQSKILTVSNAMAIRPISDAAVEKAAASIHQPRDPNTLSNYNAFKTKHTLAEFEVDFDAKRLKGHVELTLERLAKDEKKIVLDTSYLDVSSVEVSGSKAKYDLASSRT